MSPGAEPYPCPFVARSGRSLQELLRARLIEMASRPAPDALMAQVRERKDRTGSRLDAARILAHRDADRA